MPSADSGSWKAFSSSLSVHSDWWRCPEHPGSFSFTLAMKQAVSPWREQISFTTVLKSAALSAAFSRSS